MIDHDREQQERERLAAAVRYLRFHAASGASYEPRALARHLAALAEAVAAREGIDVSDPRFVAGGEGPDSPAPQEQPTNERA